jgi:hypothetical protein
MSERILIGVRVKIVDDVGKTNSNFVGKQGIVIGYKPNKFREGGFIPVVELDSGQVVSGWPLWFEVER